MDKFQFKSFKNIDNGVDISYLDENHAKQIYDFHKSIPGYINTPLADLKKMSEKIGLKKFYVKDESYRFGLNAFKVLGGSYCCAKYIAEKAGINPETMTFDDIVNEEVRKKVGEITFTTATDGNHGRGIAWAANRLGQKSKVFMPEGTVLERLENIRKEGSDADIYEMNYDDCVREAAKYAQEHNGALVQDTSWDGYEEIPEWIMQGYITFAYESYLEMKKENNLPTHIFLQAGVGSMASAIIGFFMNIMKDNPPKIILVEPNKVDPFYRTVSANDGKIHIVEGELDSIMAGLCCGEPATVAWDIISKYVKYFVSVDDSYAAVGMRILGNPLGDDLKIISGESGAVTSGVAYKLMTEDALYKYKEELGLDENSVVYCVSTEGDTDKQGYRDIVWDGKYPFL